MSYDNKPVQRIGIYNQLNPKFLEKTESIDTYVVASTPGNINPGTIVEFFLPQGDICDLSCCYVQYNMNTVAASAAIAEVYTFTLFAYAGLPTATAGTFRIQIGESISAPLAFNATNTQILTAILNMTGFPADIDLVTDPTVSPQPLSRFTIITNTLSTANPGVLSFSINYDNLKFKIANIPVSLVSNLTNAAGSLLDFVDTSPAADGRIKYPQLDKSGSSSPFREIEFSFNGVPMFTIQNYSKLASIIGRERLVEGQYTESSILYGQDSDAFNDIDYKGKYILPLFGCYLLDKVIPVNLIPGCTPKLRLTIDTPNNFLVYDSTINPQPNVVFSNFRLYYSRLTLSPRTTQDYLNRINSPQGFRLYFKTYVTTSTSLTGSTQDVTINASVSRMTGVLAGMQEQSFVNSTLTQFRNSSFITNNIEKARLRINSEFRPQDYLNSLKSLANPRGEYAEFLIEMLVMMGQFATTREYVGVRNSEIVSLQTYTADNHTELFYPSYDRQFPPSFVIGICTNSDISDKFEDMNQLVEVGSNVAGQNVLTLELSGLQLSETNVIYVFAEYVACAHFKDGKIYLVK